MTQAALLIALFAGTLAELWSAPPHRRWPLLTLATMLAIGATWTLTSARPELLPLLSRHPAMLASGEVWRAVTALFAQDGGSPGTLFNLAWLLVLGSMAERRFSRPTWLAIYFGGGIATEFLALAWQPHGAGNSVACLALAGALCSDWRAGRGRWWRASTGLAGLAAAAVLIFADDIHGIGFVLGMAIGFVLAARSAKREREIAAANDNVVVFMPGSDTYH
jgi:rhomboid protease GluP